MSKIWDEGSQKYINGEDFILAKGSDSYNAAQKNGNSTSGLRNDGWGRYLDKEEYSFKKNKHSYIDEPLNNSNKKKTSPEIIAYEEYLYKLNNWEFKTKKVEKYLLKSTIRQKFERVKDRIFKGIIEIFISLKIASIFIGILFVMLYISLFIVSSINIKIFLEDQNGDFFVWRAQLFVIPVKNVIWYWVMCASFIGIFNLIFAITFILRLKATPELQWEIYPQKPKQVLNPSKRR